MKLNRTVIIILAVSLVLSLLPAACPSQAAGKAALYGHRGYSSKYPENTMTAFKGAKKAGFNGIEVDVWESDNGDLMVFHDKDIKRLTKKSGKIWNINTKNRKKYPVVIKGRKEQIPTLDETLKYASKAKLSVLIHVKNDTDGKHKLTAKGAKKITALVKKYKLTKKAVVFVTKWNNHNKLAGKGVRLGYLTFYSDRKNIDRIIKRLSAAGTDTLFIYEASTIKSKNFRKDFVSSCHKNGIKAATYMTYTKSEYKAMSSLEVDFCMSDYNLK